MTEIPYPPQPGENANEQPALPPPPPLVQSRRGTAATVMLICGIALLTSICGCVAFGYWGLFSTGRRMEEFSRRTVERMRETSGGGPLYTPGCPMAAASRAMDQERKAIRHALETDLAGMREEADRLPEDSMQRRELMERIHGIRAEIQALEARPHMPPPDMDR